MTTGESSAIAPVIAASPASNPSPPEDPPEPPTFLAPPGAGLAGLGV